MSNLQQQYQLCQKIHQLLPQINQKYGLEIEVESEYFIAKPIKGIGADKEKKFELVSADYIDYKEEEYSYEWEKIPAIQEPQIRQILVGLQEVIRQNPNLYPAVSYWADWMHGFPTCRFDTDPILVLTELLEILENLLK